MISKTPFWGLRHLNWTPLGSQLALDGIVGRRWMSSGSKTTCLNAFHRNRQARMELFAGYSMPIVYKDQTIRSEHMQTRQKASAFDVSHMMQVHIRGRDRHRFLEALTVADIEGMKLNKCTLSVLTNQSGGMIDDCIIGKKDDLIHMVSNAGNAEIVWAWLNEHRSKSLDVHLERLEDKGLIALQGPSAATVLQTMVKVDLKNLRFMETTDTEVCGVGVCTVTRCGYTGEDGFEISVAAKEAMKLMEALCENGDVKPAGLGARDTLRLEAGLCLHGHDITDKITPVEAALNWVIGKRRRQAGGFIGSEKVLQQLKEGSQIKRVGLVAKGPGPPAREGSKVKDLDGSDLGLVTSGTFAPRLEKNIAMAYVPTKLSKEIGKVLHCEVRGKAFEYELAKMPFVKSNYYI